LHKDAYILAADTTVAVGRRILGKAENETEARAFLELLSGRRHRVVTGVSLIAPTGKSRHKLVSSVVKFKRLSKIEIDNYIASGEWKGKAGAYGIQGLGSVLITYISGSYT